ncbi:hypothetical protein GQX73_g10762 [Xylaria multiplex]|uniref:Luciferase domain-containing protein n=1 Tax=Xylaria multiplex TaxID=323545 RepID=A0A7C8MJB3_9PEZI|nr:hypothetical protein GQX73_g10762 [Xylaria multiplex]
MATSLTQAGLLSTQSLVSESPPTESKVPPYFSVTVRQDSLTVTLDGPTIFILSASLIFAIQFLQPVTVAVLIGLATVILFVHNDYQNFIKLGPGGTPSTFVGYVRINWLKLWALRNPFDPLPSDKTMQPANGILTKKPLPYRCGPRPRVVGIAPQRQVNQFGSRECYLALRRILENHGLGEICHVHNSDHSLHLNLHPDDAKEVIEKGWGQRHPLTSRCFLFKMPVPRQFTMVYAPRSRDELKVVCQIIEAAGWWVVAKEIRLDMLGEVQ